MNFTKSLLTIGIASTLFFGCKDTASNATSTSKDSSTEAQKENAVALKPETASFKIDGMTCAMGCAKTIESKLSNTDGVQKAAVDFDKKEATIEFDASVLTPEKLTEVVEKTGDGATYKVKEMKIKTKA
jgi:mercuric ion binding protein